VYVDNFHFNGDTQAHMCAQNCSVPLLQAPPKVCAALSHSGSVVQNFMVSKQSEFAYALLCIGFYWEEGKEQKHSFVVGEILQPWLFLPKESVRVVHVGQYLIAGFSKSSFQINEIVTLKKVYWYICLDN